MNNEPLCLDIKPSKIYLSLFISIYLLALLSSWFYFYNLLLSVILSGILSLWAWYFFPQNVLLNKPQSIKKITFNNNIIIEKKDGTTHRYPSFCIDYQSNFLVIIHAEKTPIIIFKDSVENATFPALKRLLTMTKIP